jgi:transcriptional regulator with XRE-family HTH domain
MQAQGVNQVQLSRRTGIAVSRVNNYLAGAYRTIKPAHLAAICSALGGTPAELAPLAQAYLYDLLPPGCRGLVDVRIPGTRDNGWEVPTKGLPADFAAAFREFYILCVANPKVRQRTSEWVALMRETKG